MYLSSIKTIKICLKQFAVINIPVISVVAINLAVTNLTVAVLVLFSFVLRLIVDSNRNNVRSCNYI